MDMGTCNPSFVGDDLILRGPGQPDGGDGSGGGGKSDRTGTQFLWFNQVSSLPTTRWVWDSSVLTLEG